MLCAAFVSQLAIICSIIGSLKGLRITSPKVLLDESKVESKEIPDSKF